MRTKNIFDLGGLQEMLYVVVILMISLVIYPLVTWNNFFTGLITVATNKILYRGSPDSTNFAPPGNRTNAKIVLSGDRFSTKIMIYNFWIFKVLFLALFQPILQNLLIQFDNFQLLLQCKSLQEKFYSFYEKRNAANHFYFHEEKITFCFSLQQFSSLSFKSPFKMSK